MGGGEKLTYTVPDGASDIFFIYTDNGMNAFVHGGKSTKAEIALSGNSVMFGVRFFPGALRFFLNCHAKDILEQRIPLSVFLDKADIFSEMGTAYDFSGRIRVMRKYLDRCARGLIVRDNSLSVTNIIVKGIVSSYGTLKVQDIARELGYSERTIRRFFDTNIGFSPKQLNEFVRFQKSLVMTVYYNDIDRTLTDIAAECGYYDLSHMNKSYHFLTGFSPRDMKIDLLK